MAYILVSEGCKGNKIKFIEQDGEFLQKPIGRQYSGTLVLQTVEDRDCQRIFFTGTTMLFGGMKKLFGITKAVYGLNPVDAYNKANADYTCLFEFRKEELRSGKKKITYSVQIVGFMMLCVLSCYDFKDHTGCCYMFPDYTEAEKWARQLGLTEYEILDSEGNTTGRAPLK